MSNDYMLLVTPKHFTINNLPNLKFNFVSHFL